LIYNTFEEIKMIEIKCKGTHWLKLHDIHILQDSENFCLKELSKKSFDKLSKSLLRFGFQFPFFIWYCEEEKIYYTVDGTQRLKVLITLEKSGNALPEKFPCVEIEAKDKKEAARTILLQSSSYGKITQEGYDAFSENFELCDCDLCECLDLGVITFEDIDLSEAKDRKEEKACGSKKYCVIIECDDQDIQEVVYNDLKNKYSKVTKK